MIEITKNVACDKKDVVKAGITSSTLNDLGTKKITITGLLFFNKVDDETGEVKTVTALKLKDGSFVTTISPTVRQSAEMIANAFEEEIAGGLELEVKKQKSKQGRDFLLLDLV